MISVNDAKNLIYVCSFLLESEKKVLKNIYAQVSYNDIFSPIDFPEFRQAAMDGYAICIEGSDISKGFEIKDVIEAGNTKKFNLSTNQAYRIFTGAKVPNGADTVIQQELIDIQNNRIFFDIKTIKNGANIREKGSQTKKNELIIKKHDEINAGTMAFLSGLGINEIEIYRRPKIAIINTGKELVKTGGKLKEGQIYESNSYSLHNALAALHITPQKTVIVNDDFEEIKKEISSSLKENDILLITGGVSVGDYDYVPQALAANGVKEVFHKIKQKPGKPLYFGIKDKTLIFGLPGNPASVLTCFYQYVIPSIKKMMGFKEYELRHLLLPCLNHYEKKKGLTHFLKAKLHQNGTVEILAHQESYKMNTYSIANALVEIDEDCTEICKGNLIKTYIFY